MKNRLLPVLLAALITLALSPAAANAYRYSFMPSDDHAHVMDIDPSMDVTIQVVRGGTQVSANTDGPGYVSENFNAQTGDVVNVFQPAPADIATATPVASFTMPDFNFSATAGSPVVTGTAPDGWRVTAGFWAACHEPNVTGSTVAGGGAFSVTLPVAGGPGSHYSAIAVSPEGNILGTHGDPASLDNAEDVWRVPGDASCFEVYASSARSDGQGPYGIRFPNADYSSEPSIRLVLRRGATTIAEESYDGIELTAAQKPLPGDTIDVYRPAGAAAPSMSWTIPAISGVYDSSNGLAAIDAPAAQQLRVWACAPGSCFFDESTRGAWGTPAGRTLVDFSQAQGENRPFSLAGAQVAAEWMTPGASYSFDLTPGDLSSPVGKLSLAKSLKGKTLGKKSLKVKFTSNEAGSSVAKLTIPGKTKKSRPVTLATSKSAAVKAGGNTLTLKFSKSGKKAAKKLVKTTKKKGKKKTTVKKTTATLTLTLTDAAGNVTTVVKTTTIK